jgi:hypothetical protein
MSRTAASFAIALCVASAAGAYRYDVEEWSATWEGFSDDFEDGLLPVVGSGGAPIYLPICAVTSESETGGALVLEGPDPLCPNTPGAVLATTGGSTVGEIRATFRFEVPAFGQVYGITLSDAASTDIALLVVARTEIPILAPDALLVALLTDPTVGGLPTPVAFDVLSLEPPHDSVSAAAIELRLVTAPGGGGVLPTGSYRLCESSPCEDEATPPFEPLAAAPTAPPDGGALVAALPHGPALLAFSPGAGDFAFEVEEWSTLGSASDDFESAAFGDGAPYGFSCGGEADVEQADGTLALRGPIEPCGATGLAFLAAHPGPLSIHARYGFTVPGLCEAYGISAGPNGSDFAFLSLVRSPDPLDPESGAEALYVRLSSEPESGGPLIPVVASARISGDPLSDPALADVRAIEFELELGADLAGLVPAGRFRLCGETSCPPDFTPLEPGSAASDPDAILCGYSAASYDPPADGSGMLVWEGPIGASLFATRVPEPGPAAAGGSALLTVLALRRRRRPMEPVAGHGLGSSPLERACAAGAALRVAGVPGTTGADHGSDHPMRSRERAAG